MKDEKKILILEDNKNTRERLRGIVSRMEQELEIFTFDNLKDAYHCALETSIDLFMVDIILKSSDPADSSGLKFVDRIRKVSGYAFTPVIIITSLQDPKYYAYEQLHCYGYVEKPFKEEKVRELLKEALKFPSQEQEEKYLYFRKEGLVFSVALGDIVHVQSIGRSIHIFTIDGGELKLPYLSIDRVKKEADTPDLIQCSRNALINRKYVESVDIPNRFIILKEGFGQIEVGITFKNTIKEIFKPG